MWYGLSVTDTPNIWPKPYNGDYAQTNCDYLFMDVHLDIMFTVQKAHYLEYSFDIHTDVIFAELLKLLDAIKQRQSVHSITHFLLSDWLAKYKTSSIFSMVNVTSSV